MGESGNSNHMGAGGPPSQTMVKDVWFCCGWPFPFVEEGKEFLCPFFRKKMFIGAFFSHYVPQITTYNNNNNNDDNDNNKQFSSKKTAVFSLVR